MEDQDGTRDPFDQPTYDLREQSDEIREEPDETTRTKPETADEIDDKQEDVRSEGESPVLYHLSDSCTLDDVVEGQVYSGTVDATVEYGAFVRLNRHVSGLVHESNMSERLAVGDDVKVRVSEIKPNDDVELVPVYMHDYEEADVVGETRVAERRRIDELDDHVGDRVALEAEVTRTYQTSGPTI
ncbi:MAG: S1 RNA-binding domain-containing protein, partial [Halobacteriales archaeon]